VEHIGWNSRDRIPDTGLQFIKSVNWCSEHNALDITPQEKNPVVLCLVNGGFSKPRVDFVDTLYNYMGHNAV
jgi:hypothetical protein